MLISTLTGMHMYHLNRRSYHQKNLIKRENIFILQKRRTPKNSDY